MTQPPYQRTTTSAGQPATAPASSDAPAAPAPEQQQAPEQQTAPTTDQQAAPSTDQPVQEASPSPPGDDYDNEDVWSYRDLQQEVKGRGLNAQGTREELVHRLRDDDAARSISANTATASTDQDTVQPDAGQSAAQQDTAAQPETVQQDTSTQQDTTQQDTSAQQDTTQGTTDGGNTATMTSTASDQPSSADNLGAETTTPDAPSADQTPTGDPGDQVPEHGSIGLQETDVARNQAEVLQGLSDERRAAQLDALKEQNLTTGGQPTQQSDSTSA